MTDVTRTLDAVWRIESARIVGALARLTGDICLAEDVAQEAVVDALTQWPAAGIPMNPGAWLTAVAKRKAIDVWNRNRKLDDRYRSLAQGVDDSIAGVDSWQPIEDDALRLVFTACHPVLGREAQIALTLRIIGGLSTAEIARMFFVPVATIQQRIVRAKATLGAAKITFEAPERNEWHTRIASVLGVAYLIFTEGYAATTGNQWIRRDLADEGLRLGRVLAELLPREPEAQALVALMEFQASRFGARTRPDGTPILLADQDRRRWDRGQIQRGRTYLVRADAVARSRGPYALQAAIAECHATAETFDHTDWHRIVLLYEALGSIAPNPIVDLNRAVAVSMAMGPATALAIVDRIDSDGALRGSYLLASVRGELLAKLGRTAEARSELLTAARLATNSRERDVLLAKVDGLQ